MSRAFYAILLNTLAASLVNTFVWFSVTFWVYLQTRSVIATSIMAGVYTGTVAVSGLFLGSLVDRYSKKRVMLLSSACSLALYAAAGALFALTPTDTFADATSPLLFLFIVLTLVGAIAGNLRTIALSTLVAIMIPEDDRDKANGLVGTVTGVAFFVASTLSGLAIGLLGMGWMLAISVGATVAVIGHLLTLTIPDRATEQSSDEPAGDDGAMSQGASTVDIRGTIVAVRAIPGLFALLFFQAFNNFLGGVFMSLMDAYGLSLVSVEVWGALFGVLSLGFIVGGLVVAKVGLGASPLRTLFLVNIAMWTSCIFFTIQRSVPLLTMGIAVWLCLIPAAEAAEQTILQKVVPPERQGRVFGFAQSLEQAAAPVTTFLIGPIAQLIFIPFMTDGAGVDLIGGWFGTGADRGIALVFTLAGVIGLAVTLLAMRSEPYRRLSARYRGQPVEATATA